MTSLWFQIWFVSIVLSLKKMFHSCFLQIIKTATIFRLSSKVLEGGCTHKTITVTVLSCLHLCSVGMLFLTNGPMRLLFLRVLQVLSNEWNRGQRRRWGWDSGGGHGRCRDVTAGESHRDPTTVSNWCTVAAHTSASSSSSGHCRCFNYYCWLYSEFMCHY